MIRFVRSIRNSGCLSRVLTGTLFAAFLIVLTMEACPAFHEFIHHDADEQDHDCAVTLFQSGACDLVPALEFVPGNVFPFHFLEVPSIAGQWVPAIFLTRHVLEHAPPVCV